MIYDDTDKLLVFKGLLQLFYSLEYSTYKKKYHIVSSAIDCVNYMEIFTDK